ncbi:MAG: hypothetical protein FVQ80_17345 [Planctomycetes bacterium]|nr:hypothetical protein [Planctomycetota bacterium]
MVCSRAKFVEHLGPYPEAQTTRQQFLSPTIQSVVAVSYCMSGVQPVLENQTETKDGFRHNRQRPTLALMR